MKRNELVNMEGNNGVTSRGGGMLPVATSMGSSGMLGLEMSLHHPHHPLPEQQHRLAPPFQVATDHSHSPQPQQQLDHAAYVAGCAKRKQQPVPPLAPTSQDLQEPATFGGEYDGGGTTAAPTSVTEGTRRFSQSLSPSPSSTPWQRMKWTDNMVRLLIMIVYCVGDDAVASNATTDHGDQHSASGGNKSKKTPAASSTSAAGLLLQKKGKWKSVSRAMVEKGFYVSPQQCEDKFNDLNKRYKRVNELLGKGIACQIVENQALLDSMDNLSSKAKEEARKLLNSKHLFFREMCAYHNGGGGGGCATGVPASSSTCAPSQPPHSQSQSPPPVNHSQPQSQDQQCFHHQSELSISFPKEASFVRKGGHSSGSMLGGLNEEDDEEKDQTDNNVDNETGDEDEEVEEEDEDDDYDEDEEEEDVNHHHRRKHKNEKSKASKLTKGTSMLLPTSSLSDSPPLSLSPSPSPPVPMDQLRCNLLGSLASVGGEQQQRQWLKRKAAELEEQRVVYQSRALGLERQRFKWLRYSSNKEREMERMKLNHERRCLENDRMLLLLRQKEQELIDKQLHHQNQLH